MKVDGGEVVKVTHSVGALAPFLFPVGADLGTASTVAWAPGYNPLIGREHGPRSGQAPAWIPIGRAIWLPGDGLWGQPSLGFWPFF